MILVLGMTLSQRRMGSEWLCLRISLRNLDYKNGAIKYAKCRKLCLNDLWRDYWNNFRITEMTTQKQEEAWNENVETCSGCGIKWKKIGKQCQACFALAEKRTNSPTKEWKMSEKNLEKRLKEIANKDRGTTHWEGCEDEHDRCFLFKLLDQKDRGHEALIGVLVGALDYVSKYDFYNRQLSDGKNLLEHHVNAMAKDALSHPLVQEYLKKEKI